MRGKIILLLGLSFYMMSRVSIAAPLSEGEKEKMREGLRKLGERTMQRLKETNPALYQETVKMRELSLQISDITSSYRRGKLDEATARKRLAPLVRETLEKRIQNLESEIERTTKKLDYLKRVKKNPNLLIEQQIDVYIGKGAPEEYYLFRR